MKSTAVRMLLFVMLFLVSISLIVMMRSRGIGLDNLIQQRDRLFELVTTYKVLAAFLFIFTYILVVAFSVPGATVLSLLGGFFFGKFLGLLLVNIGATTGALLIFLATRYLIRDTILRRYKDQLATLNRELEQNGANYLLTLRFIPLFPFFLINLLAGLTPVSVWTFLWTTAVGIIPGSIVYTMLGSSGATITSAESAVSPQLIAGLVLLGFVSLIPVGIRKFFNKKEA